MATIGADDLRSMAQTFHDIGVAVGQIRLEAIHNGEPLNDPQIVNLLGASLSLFNLSSSFAVQAAEVTLDDAAGVVATVRTATGQATAALKTLQQLDKAIRIGMAVVVLGTSVFTADPQQIGKAAKGVIDAVAS